MEQKPKYLLNYPFWEQNKNKQLKNGEECHSWINKVQVYCFYRLGPTFQHCILGNGKPEASELGKELGKKQNKTNSVFFPIPNYVFKISWNQNVLFPNSLHSSELCPTSLHLLALNSTGAAECRKCLGWGPRSRGGGGGGDRVSLTKESRAACCPPGSWSGGACPLRCLSMPEEASPGRATCESKSHPLLQGKRTQTHFLMSLDPGNRNTNFALCEFLDIRNTW